LPLAKQAPADGPIVAIMLVNDDLGGVPIQFQYVGNGLGDRLDQTAAFLQGPALGDMNSYKWHVCLLGRPAL